MILQQDDDVPPDTSPELLPEIPQEDTPQISLHAMLGHTSPKLCPLSIRYKIEKVTILIESTHNFMQECIVCFLNLPISNSNKFHVMIDNGEQLVCNTRCLNVPILLCNTIDFFILPVRGADFVLGSMVENLAPYHY